MKTFTKAIVRTPGRSLVDGLTMAGLGAVSIELALEQHRDYCRALQGVGVEVIRLEADESFPDSTFVEDTAVLVDGVAIVTIPGAESRAGETAAVASELASHFDTIHQIASPGTLDGGDVCQVESRFYIGISHRTNEEGARQLSERLGELGYAASMVDIRGIEGLLHLKSGLTFLGSGLLLMSERLVGKLDTAGLEVIRVDESEEYAANSLPINDHILIPTGFPRTRQTLSNLGYTLIELNMSEFQKLDGGLTCLSLRF